MEDAQQDGAANNKDIVVTQDQARLVADQLLYHSSIPNRRRDHRSGISIGHKRGDQYKLSKLYDPCACK